MAITATLLVTITNTQLVALFLFDDTGTENIGIAFSLFCIIIGVVVATAVLLARPEWCTYVQPEQRCDFALTCVSNFAFHCGINTALSSISTALQQLTLTCVPFVTIILESLVWWRLDHWFVYLVVVCIISSAALTSGSGQFTATPEGVVAGLFGVLGTAGKFLFTRRLMAGSSHATPLHPVALVMWQYLALSVPLFVWAAASSQLYTFFGAQVLGSSLSRAGLGMATATVGAFVAISEVVALTYVSATSLSVAYMLVPLANIVLSLFITQTGATGDLSPLTFTGLALVVLLTLLYMELRVDTRALPAVDRALGCEGRRQAKGGARHEGAAREDTLLYRGDEPQV